jgi:hypothetical protein
VWLNEAKAALERVTELDAVNLSDRSFQADAKP